MFENRLAQVEDTLIDKAFIGDDPLLWSLLVNDESPEVTKLRRNIVASYSSPQADLQGLFEASYGIGFGVNKISIDPCLVGLLVSEALMFFPNDLYEMTPEGKLYLPKDVMSEIQSRFNKEDLIRLAVRMGFSAGLLEAVDRCSYPLDEIDITDENPPCGSVDELRRQIGVMLEQFRINADQIVDALIPDIRTKEDYLRCKRVLYRLREGGPLNGFLAKWMKSRVEPLINRKKASRVSIDG
ncbi:hypothetical protein GF357_03240, partial [Candidatus Dojkabacteria bacterium]|nr:hypothetical protein [Candidatus Dojkabacteria bacterium]